MPKYNVHFRLEYDVELSVEAEDVESALESATSKMCRLASQHERIELAPGTSAELVHWYASLITEIDSQSGERKPVWSIDE